MGDQISRYSAMMTQRASDRVHVRVLLSHPVADALGELGQRLSTVPELRDRLTRVQRTACGEPYLPITEDASRSVRDEALEVIDCPGRAARFLAEALVSWIVETGNGLRVLIRGTQPVPLLVELPARRLRSTDGRRRTEAVFELTRRLNADRAPESIQAPGPPEGEGIPVRGTGSGRQSIPVGENEAP